MRKRSFTVDVSILAVTLSLNVVLAGGTWVLTDAEMAGIFGGFIQSCSHAVDDGEACPTPGWDCGDFDGCTGFKNVGTCEREKTDCEFDGNPANKCNITGHGCFMAQYTQYDCMPIYSPDMCVADFLTGFEYDCPGSYAMGKDYTGQG